MPSRRQTSLLLIFTLLHVLSGSTPPPSSEKDLEDCALSTAPVCTNYNLTTRICNIVVWAAGGDGDDFGPPVSALPCWDGIQKCTCSFNGTIRIQRGEVEDAPVEFAAAEIDLRASVAMIVERGMTIRARTIALVGGDLSLPGVTIAAEADLVLRGRSVAVEDSSLEVKDPSRWPAGETAAITGTSVVLRNCTLQMRDLEVNGVWNGTVGSGEVEVIETNISTSFSFDFSKVYGMTFSGLSVHATQAHLAGQRFEVRPPTVQESSLVVDPPSAAPSLSIEGHSTIHAGDIVLASTTTTVRDSRLHRTGPLGLSVRAAVEGGTTGSSVTLGRGATVDADAKVNVVLLHAHLQLAAGASMSAQSVSISVFNVDLATNSTVWTTRLEAAGENSVSIACDLPGPVQSHRDPPNSSMLLLARTTVVASSILSGVSLGRSGQRWDLERLEVYQAPTIDLVDDFAVSTRGSSCSNRHVESAFMQRPLPSHVCGFSKSDERIHEEDGQPTPVAFDLCLTALGQLTVGHGVRLEGGSVLLAARAMHEARGEVVLKSGAAINVSGRGCSPKDTSCCTGPTREWNMTLDNHTGSHRRRAVRTFRRTLAGGGAQHCDMRDWAVPGARSGGGGAGAVYMPGSVASNSRGAVAPFLGKPLPETCVRNCSGIEQCTPPVASDDPECHNATEDMLPTFMPTWGASSGGWPYSDYDPPPEPDIFGDLRPSAGGGLIWLSADTLAFHPDVLLLADGHPGVKLLNNTTASGGGAGGQVLLLARVIELKDIDGRHPTIRARGGNATCADGFIGGAGGGGFVGLAYKGKVPDEFTSDAQIMAQKTSVQGGTLDSCAGSTRHFPQKDCNGIPNSWQIAEGDHGAAAALQPCEQGFGSAGILCTPCAINQRSEFGDMSCSPCTTGRNFYVYHPKSPGGCEFVCDPAVPSRSINPDCKDFPHFLFGLIRDSTALITILLGLVFVFLLLLIRHARSGRKPLRQNLLSSALLGHRPRRFEVSRMQSMAANDLEGNEVLCCTFGKELLPFHVCRVFLCGSNDLGAEWSLDGRFPEVLDDLVDHESWENLVHLVGEAAEVVEADSWGERLLMFYPPLVPILNNRRRRARARQIHALIGDFSEGVFHQPVWKPIRARMQEGRATGEVFMTFGCDNSVTLGFVDFFDRVNDRMDWGVTDMSGVQILVAQGDGSRFAPFALDIADPLVLNLVEGGVSKDAVFTVISVFNRLSRLISKELLTGQDAPVVWQLQGAVQRCAEACWLDGKVQVLVLPVAVPMPGEDEMSAEYASSSGSVLGGSLLSNSLSVEDPARPTGVSPKTTGEAYRLCLAFTNSRGISQSGCSPSHSPVATMGAFRREQSWSSELRPNLLASPMQPGKLRELQEMHKPVGDSPNLHRLAWSRDPGALCMKRLQHTLRLACGPGGSNCRRCSTQFTAPVSVLAGLMALLFLDFFNFVFVMWTLANSQSALVAITISLLLPPLAQPLAVILGPWFVLTEDVVLGRLYASLTVFSSVNTIAVEAYLMFAGHSLVFEFLHGILGLVIKLGLFWFSSAHVRNLELAHDLSFASANQSRFVNKMVAPALGISRNVSIRRDDSSEGTSTMYRDTHISTTLSSEYPDRAAQDARDIRKQRTFEEPTSTDFRRRPGEVTMPF